MKQKNIGIRKFFFLNLKEEKISIPDIDTDTGIQCCGSGMFIPDPGSRISDLGSRILDPGSRISDPGSRIPDLGSRIQKTAIKERGEKICCHTFFCSHKFHKIELNAEEKNLGQFSKNFLPKKLSPSSQKYGFGIRDPGVKKAPDPGSGKKTLPV
jgi:hypothetical protein